MAKIIRQDFSTEDFNKMVHEFLFSDPKVSLSKESLLKLQEHLVKAGPAFKAIFTPYFEKTDNTRYDDLTRKMENFIKKIMKYSAALQGEERKALILFWNETADIITADCMQMQVQYLTNCCNYFIWEINKLS